MHRPDDGMDEALIRRIRIGWPATLACALALLAPHASHAGEWALCAPSTLPPPPSADLETSTIAGNSASLRDDGVSVVEGDVVLRTPARTITSDRMEYDAEAGRAEASGRVAIRERDMFLEGSRLEADFETGETVLEDATFNHPDSHGRGDAKRIENDSRRTVITGGSFTTCDPGSNAWRLEAESLELDHESGTGTARNAQLSFFGFPLLYTPWITFPIGSDRKSGFLIPTFESSDNAGSSLTLPYYLNLAPNYDATLRPRLTSRRGEVLGGEFRFLTEGGAGTIEAETVPDDRITGDSRSLVSFRHRYRSTTGLETRVQYARASDADYLRDLDTGTAVGNTNFLRQFAEVAYELPGLRFALGVENHQVLKNTPAHLDPYRISPRVALESRLSERNWNPNIDFHGEAARFDHHTDMVATGTRLDVRPSAYVPLRSSFGYLIPRATLHITGYDFDEVAGDVPDSLSRTVPSFSVDGGLYFDHDVTVGERRFTQTLEPRLFYLRVPYRDQDRLPLFDAGSFSFGYDHMFRENRFSGTDRIGDADRLTLALDSRLLDGGREIFTARFGTMHHFRDRRVRLCTIADPAPGVLTRCGDSGSPDALDPSRSTWIAALRAHPHDAFTVGGTVEHDGSESRNRAVSLDFRYHPSPERIVNIGYRRFPRETVSSGEVQEWVRDATESVTLSAHHDLGPNLRVLGSASYALAEDRATELYTGLEFDTCCWSARVVGQRYLAAGSTDHESSIVIQLDLKGLTGFGGGVERSRIRPVPGYRNPF